eukprot:4957342-Prymnesium_polylepis.4
MEHLPEVLRSREQGFDCRQIPHLRDVGELEQVEGSLNHHGIGLTVERREPGFEHFAERVCAVHSSRWRVGARGERLEVLKLLSVGVRSSEPGTQGRH